MMESQNVCCPYCGEAIELLIDDSIPEQEYIEDCQVCCRPITIMQNTDIFSGEMLVSVKHENE